MVTIQCEAGTFLYGQRQCLLKRHIGQNCSSILSLIVSEILENWRIEISYEHTQQRTFIIYISYILAGCMYFKMEA